MQAINWRRATLIVIEYGGSWPAWLSTNRESMAVVAQHYEGPPSSLITQVATRLTRLEAMNWRCDWIVLVSNGRTDSAATAARSILARGLLARLSSNHSGCMILSANERADRRAIHGLVGLAKALGDSIHPGIELYVRIGAEQAVSSDQRSSEPLAHAS